MSHQLEPGHWWTLIFLALGRYNATLHALSEVSGRGTANIAYLHTG